jgi:hypothetical protein
LRKTQEKIEIEEVVEHEIFIDDMPPIRALDFRQDGRAQHRVERDQLIKVREARPFQIFRQSDPFDGPNFLVAMNQGCIDAPALNPPSRRSP